MILYIIRKLFLEKEIMSRQGVLHFRRWRIISTPWFGIYIHRIYKADDDKYLHDHPWDYWSMVLTGSYNEQTETLIRPGHAKENMLIPGSCNSRMAEQFHKIKSLNTKSVTTLFVTGKRRRDWGYKVGKYWVHNEYYRQNKHVEELINSQASELQLTDKVRLL